MRPDPMTGHWPRPFSRARALLLGLALTGLLGACDSLGNPPVVLVTTEPLRWSGGPLTTVTQAQATTSQRWPLFSARFRGGLHHQDRLPPDGVMALVSVEARWGRRAVPAHVPLVTEIELVDGRIVRRTWHAPGRSPVWLAAFAVPAPPRSAITALR